MKIVHLNFGATWGGGEQQILQLLHGLRSRGCEVTLLAPSGSALLRRLRAEDGLDAQAFDCWSPYCPFAARRLRRLLRRLRPDVLHLHHGRAGALGIPAARGIPGLAVVLHRRIASPMPRNPLSRARNRSRRVDAYVAVSGAARASLSAIAIAQQRVHVIPSGIDPQQHTGTAVRAVARRELGLASEVVIGTVGALSPMKDHATFVRCAALLAAEDPDLHFLVIGEGRERLALESQASESGLAGRLRFLGHVEAAHRTIAAMDFFVFPSLREGSPGAVKEAMAWGVPVVAADAPGTLEVLGRDGGIAVPGGDAAAFAGAIRELRSHPERARTLVQRARQRIVEHFTMQQTVERTLQVYEQVAAVRAGGGVHA